MKSPFPGMDPYLEKHWRDVHASLIIYARDFLKPSLPRGLLARVEERVFLETEVIPTSRSMYPDLRVVQHRPGKRFSAPAGVGLLEPAEPVLIRFRDEPVTETFLQIVDAATGHEVVTVIEFLSPANKNWGDGQTLYRKKQEEILQSSTSLVEIDLLRGGERVQVAKPNQIPRQYQTIYQVCVRRGWKNVDVEIYPITLRQRLPILRIPLRPKDSDLPLDLQALIDQAYEMGSYGETINYQAPPEPPLIGPDAAWAKKLLSAAAKATNGKKTKKRRE